MMAKAAVLTIGANNSIIRGIALVVMVAKQSRSPTPMALVAKPPILVIYLKICTCHTKHLKM